MTPFLNRLAGAIPRGLKTFTENLDFRKGRTSRWTRAFYRLSEAKEETRHFNAEIKSDWYWPYPSEARRLLQGAKRPKASKLQL